MIYAPVLIATLNRYEHLKKCLEALESNKLSSKTDIYISVDFPIKEQYVDGYKQVVEYLNMKKGNSLFANTHVFFQKENLGPAMNYRFLREKAYQKFDRIILIEDDLIVSSNFLEYMDKAMELFVDNPDVYYICGYSAFGKKDSNKIEDNEIILRSAFNPWGIGEFKKKRDIVRQSLSREWLDSVGNSWKDMLRIYRYRKYTFWLFVNLYLLNQKDIFFCSDGSVREMDVVLDIWLLLNKKYSAFPTISKTKNFGFDGSGINCSVKNEHNLLELDRRCNIDISERKVIRLNLKEMRLLSYNGIKDKSEVAKALLGYLIWKIIMMIKR